MLGLVLIVAAKLRTSTQRLRFTIALLLEPENEVSGNFSGSFVNFRYFMELFMKFALASGGFNGIFGRNLQLQFRILLRNVDGKKIKQQYTRLCCGSLMLDENKKKRCTTCTI